MFKIWSTVRSLCVISMTNDTSLKQCLNCGLRSKEPYNYRSTDNYYHVDRVRATRQNLSGSVLVASRSSRAVQTEMKEEDRESCNPVTVTVQCFCVKSAVPVCVRVRVRPQNCCQTTSPETRTTSRRSARTERPRWAETRSAIVSSASVASLNLSLMFTTPCSTHQHKLIQVPVTSLRSLCVLLSELPLSWTEPLRLRRRGEKVQH